MLNYIFQGLFDTDTTSVIALSDFLLCICCSLILGAILAGCYIYKTKYSKGFVATLALLPAIVCVVIMMVNGNVGTGVAVAGAFSLIRFRSAPGTAKEIGAIFIAMGTGLITGMGYLGYAALCTLLLGGISMLYSHIISCAEEKSALNKTLQITIPEDLNYTNIFTPILDNYTACYELTRVKTTNMGSLFKLTYDLTLNDLSIEKELIDKLRCKNGNLEISISRQENNASEL